MSIKTRKSNGQGHTFKVGNSWKTVITSQGRTVTATAKTQQESKRRAKEKVHQLPAANNGKVLGASKVTLGEYLLPWLDFQHKNAIASTTYRRYRGLAVATRTKVAFETETGTGSRKKRRDKFSDSIGIMRDNIVRVVMDLLSLGR